MIIYKIQNKTNNKIYIGQTKLGLSQRIANHLNSKFPIGCALRKYGLQCFDVTIIASANDCKILSDREKEYIESYDCKVPNGYNMTDGGEGSLNPSQEVRLKMRNARLGKKESEETKVKVGASSKGRNVGRCYTEEQKEKIRISHLGKKASEETRVKMSRAHKGKLRTEEHCRNISKGQIGKIIPEDTKKKISETLKGRKLSEEHKRKISENSAKYWKGKCFSEEVRQRMREAQLNSLNHVGMKGKKHSEETKIKMKESARVMWVKRKEVYAN